MPDAPEPTLDPFVGRTFGDYEVLARVGGGSMGVVYRGRHVRLNSPRALKFLPPQWSHDEDAKLRFRREAEAASATDHPNICTIHDICETPDGQLFIVMAFCGGMTLKARLAGEPLSIHESLDIATQMADGLGKAHGQGVVHRDVKPGNVMLTEDGVRLVDFGLATFADALQLTMAGSQVGTAAYMSPEQVRGDRADARSDVWAVGVVLYQMLAGRLPFGGTHGEGVEHAIRHEPAEAIRPHRPDVPEDVEQIVFRAMHKDPAVRFQNGRELARALKTARGLADHTQVVPVPVTTTRPEPTSSRTTASRWMRGVAAALALLIGVGLVWLYVPVDRVRVVIAPFGNQTGDAALDGYRLALTQATTLALGDSPVVAVEPYARVLEAIGRFLYAGADPSNREAIQALNAHAQGAAMLVPTLLREDGTWRVRLELRNGITSTSDWTFESEPVVSSLSLDAAYRLALGLVPPIEGRFASRRSQVRRAVEAAIGLSPSGGLAPARSLEAAHAFEEGTRWYQELEYASARRAFRVAVDRDPRNPVLLAWLSRAAQITRQDTEATEMADRALAALGPTTPSGDALFVQAVAAEVRREFDVADARYRALAEAHPDDPEAIMERAGFLDRQARNSDALAAYHQALALDSRLLRPRLELCRLYGSRLSEPAEAKRHGQAALVGYRAIGARGGEAQALLCLVDTLRSGTTEERNTAQTYVEDAHRILEALRFDYTLARADAFAAILAGVRGQLAESVRLSENALKQAVASGNEPMQPLILNNLGVAHVTLGNRSVAAEYYRQAYEIYQRWREEARAARVQANRGALLVDYGDPEEGYRDARNALAVSQKLGDRVFEVFCLDVIATYYRNQGRHQDALSELNKGLAIARERNLADNVTRMTTDIALSEFERGNYTAAREVLVGVLGAGEGRQSGQARLQLARTHIRMGDLASAAADLDRAEKESQDATGPLLWLVRGEWAAESLQPGPARMYFERGSRLWVDALPDPAAVEARARLGLLDALAGQVDAGRAMIRESLDAAQKMGHLALAARCRLWLAQIAITGGRFDSARELLDAIPPDTDTQTIGLELRAEVRYWRGRLAARQGDAAAAAVEAKEARDQLRVVADGLPASYQQSFSKRPSIQALLQ